MSRPSGDWISLLFSAAIIAAILALPWPDAAGPSILRSIWLTTRDVNTTFAATLRDPETFQANLETPGSGEQVLPFAVQEMLTIVRGRGRAVRRYRISESLAANNWVLQQTVVALWPRRLDPRATATFVVNTDPPVAGCTVIERQQVVSLVYCP